MAAFGALHDALRARFGTQVEDVLSIPVLYDNSPPFESDENPSSPPNPQTDVWARFTVLPGETVIAETAGTLNTFRTSGVVQVQLYGPLGIGDDALLSAVDTVVDAFRVVSVSEFTLRSPSITAGRRDGDWHRIDVSAPFFADESA